MTSVLLFSGGIDSAAIAAWLRPDILLTINYGHTPAAGELRAATALAKCLDLPLQTLTVDCSSIGSGDLGEAEPLSIAPATDWWPYRNQLLVTLAASRCVCVGATELLIGTVRGDAIHADGRIEFVQALDALLALQEGELRLRAPAIAMSSVELVAKSGLTVAELAWTHSCHRADWACGQCRGCNKRQDVWRGLGYD